MSATVNREAPPALLGYLTGARWFAGKGRRAELGRLTPLPWLTEVGSWPAVRFEVVEVAYPGDGEPAGSSTELYQLAVSYRPAPEASLESAEIGRFDDPELGAVLAYDATSDPDACRVILQRLLASQRYGDAESSVSFHLLSGDALDGEPEPRVFTGQQSNTSVMFGDVAMLKLFRRLEIGRNLDIEVHESLSRAGVSDVARLYGWVEATWPSGDPAEPELSADLAMVVEKLADAEDGWGLALDWLRDGRSFTSLAGDLGRALAEIHSSLRSAFPSDQAGGAQAAAVMRRRLTEAASIAPALEPYVDVLSACFDSLADTELVTQRVHGDFHLGQTLYTPSGWKIIDFEGEPAKSLAERAAPDSVWRDVAGMLRSFDYAAASVPGSGSRQWADDCATAFLQGYADRPLTASEDASMLAYLADKAVYEVVYEVRNRPDWVSIPLAAVAAIAKNPAAAGSTTATASAAHPKE